MPKRVSYAASVYKPVNLDLGQFPEWSRDDIAWIVHSLILRIVNNDALQKRGIFVPMNNALIRRVLGSERAQDMLPLINGVIVEWDNSWCSVEGMQRSKGARFIGKYWTADWRKDYVITRTALAKKICEQRDCAEEDSSPEWLEMRDHMLAQLRRITIEIPPRLLARLSKFRRIALEEVIQACGSGQWRITKDSTAGRVHTPIVRLPSRFRRYLRVDGSPLVNNDICNSQPLIMCAQLRAFAESYMPSMPFPLSSASLSPYVSKVQNHSDRPQPDYAPDFRLFVELCEGGKLYQYLADRTQFKGTAAEQLKKVKRYYMAFAYGQHKTSGEVSRCFERHFPTVLELMKEYKRWKGYFESLAIDMQRKEADIVIWKVCKRIINERPGMFFATIHDSLLDAECDSPYVATIILSAFSDLDLSVSLRSKPA